MAYQVLARKWRPKSFHSLVGQEHVVRALSNALDNQRLHHAYLLTGTRGVGKTTIARIMGKALNCEQGVSSHPCGVCKACLQIDSGRFVDLLEIDAASNTGIDNIREVLENAQYAPTAGRFKIYIIDEVHMLSKSAFNAMLKTLEEPPPHVKFILATTDPHKVPITVLSRCLQLSLKQMTPQLITQHLSHVLDTESIAYEATALTLISHAAEGSMRDALSLLDQAIAYGAGKIEEKGIRAMLGAVDQRYIFDLLYALKAQDGLAMINLIDELHLRAVAFEAALAELLHILHQIALAQVVPAAIDEDTPHQQEVLAIAQVLSPEDVQLYYQIALHGRKDLPWATDEYAGFSMTLLRMLAFAPVESMPFELQPATPEHGKITEQQPKKEKPGATVESAQDNKKETSHFSDNTLSRPEQETSNTLMGQATCVQLNAIDEVYKADVRQRIALADFQPANWITLVNHLKGMSMMLAQNGALVSVQQNLFTLHVASQNKAVAERIYQNKLRADLSEYFNAPIMLTVNIEKEVENTPLRAKERIKDQRQDEAEKVIRQDACVQTLITKFGATIVPDSIQPTVK